MKFTTLILALIPLLAAAEPATVLHPDDLSPIVVSPGVILKELTGRSAAAPAKSNRCSVAYFVLEPGRASAWSYNKVGEESFFILKGRGEVWTDGHVQPVRPGSFILIPPNVVRSVRASQGEVLEFYAITAPAWSSEDDVLTTAPVGAPK
jgi:mannose-6-phosphate isomerase-like protein (cupin superfamily)